MSAVILLSLIGSIGARGPAEFDLAIYLPKTTGAREFAEFLKVGGERSVLLRSENWREMLHPILRFDVTRPETLAAGGLDETQSLTLIFRGDLEVSCATVKNLDKFTQACAERLKLLGTPFMTKGDGGVTTVGARDALNRVLAGYVLKGSESCAARMQGKSVEKPLEEIAKWLGKPPSGAAWKPLQQSNGAAFLITQRAVVALGAEGLGATAAARGTLPLQGLAGAGSTPYAAMSPPALLLMRVRADATALPPVIDEIALRLAALCPACEAAPFKVAGRTLSATLTGNAVVMVSRVKVAGSLRTEPGRFFAVRTAVFAETGQPDAARAALKGLETVKGAKLLESGDGISMLLREGELRVGVRGTHFYIANDAATLEAAWKAMPQQAGQQPHGAEWAVDPKLLAQALAQVPLLDALQSTELAGALAAGAELGPLLLATDKVSGWADSQRAFMSWRLKPPPLRDAGADDAGAPDAGR